MHLNSTQLVDATGGATVYCFHFKAFLLLTSYVSGQYFSYTFVACFRTILKTNIHVRDIKLFQI